MSTLFLAWQSPSDRSWHPVGQLSYDGLVYRFEYIEGARKAQLEANFQPVQHFPSFTEFYESDKLFPLFANRLLNRSRPEYEEFIDYLGMPDGPENPLTLLARSGGQRETDSFEVFPCPEPSPDGSCHLHFFAHGIRHFPPTSENRILDLHIGEQLLLVHDFQNPRDPMALMLRTNDSFEGDRHLVGYCPRYLLEDAFEILQKCSEHTVTVERINKPPAPSQFRLLCELTSCWPDDFTPFSTEIFRSLAQQPSVSGETT